MSHRVLDPIGVITRTSVARFLDAARKQAEVVLLEAPIVVESPEAQIICAQADVVVTVVDPATATVSDVSDTYRLLAEVRAQIGPAVVMSAPPVPAPGIPARLTDMLTDEPQPITPPSSPSRPPRRPTFPSRSTPIRPIRANPIRWTSPRWTSRWWTSRSRPTISSARWRAARPTPGRASGSHSETSTEAGDMDEAAEPVAHHDPVTAPTPAPPAPLRPAPRAVPTTRPAETALSKAIRRANRWRQDSTARRTPTAPRPRVAPPVVPPVVASPVVTRDDAQPQDEVHEEFLPYRSSRAPVPEAVVEPEPEAVVEPEPEAVVEPESEPVAESEPAPTAEDR